MSFNTVVFVGMVYPWGIIRHFALLGGELFKARKEFDFYFASISREPDLGAWHLIREVIPASNLIETETFDDLVHECDRLFDKYKKVLVHCGGGWGQTKAFIKLRRKYGKRLVLIGTTHSYRHDSAMRIPMSSFQALLYFLYYDKVVFQCQYAVDRFWGARLLFASGKGIVVPLGCESFDDVSLQPPSVISEKPELLKLLQEGRTFKFVYLAGFRPGKMHVWLVRALAPVLRTNPDTYVLFCGTGDKDVIRSVKEEIGREGLERQIIVPGQIPRNEVPWLLLHSNCAVVPSRAETFGHNFLEPMFAGLPVLGTRVGIGRDIIRDGETGYGFSLHEENSLRKAALLLVKDVHRTREMGKVAKRLVSENFTHTEIARQLTMLYGEMLKE